MSLNIKKFLHTNINSFIININENKSISIESKILNNEYINDLTNEVEKFNTSEEFLRSAGISTELLDRLAFGFSEGDIKELNPSQLKIRWETDLENVKWEIENIYKKSNVYSLNEIMQFWAENVDLSEPIDVDYWEDENLEFEKGFYIQDGHHRYMAAKILNKLLNVDLLIKINPIKEITNDTMGYDEFHRFIFNLLR